MPKLIDDRKFKRKAKKELARITQQNELNSIINLSNEIAVGESLERVSNTVSCSAERSNTSNETAVCTPMESNLNPLPELPVLCSQESSSDTSLNEYEAPRRNATVEVGNFVSPFKEIEMRKPLQEKLRQWTIKYNIQHNAATELLGILKDLDPELPSDSRTLLKTCRNTNIIQKGGGEFCYFGVKENLKMFNLEKICPQKVISLRINVDGLQLSRSSNVQFWPILGRIDSEFKLSPFVIACFYGSSKPNSLKEYLEDFIMEINGLIRDGLSQNSNRFTVCIIHFNCDAPARAFLKAIKNHNSYFGCEKCIQRGVAVDGHVKYLQVDSALRSDDDFINNVTEDHHVARSPLQDVENLGLVSKFPLDPMHMVDLGIVRKLLMYWIKNGERSSSNSIRISSRQTLEISKRLVSFSRSKPMEFSRKPRSLKDIERWKATEFRQFLLYIGPIALKGILSKTIYRHFLCLHAAIRILADSSAEVTNIDEAEDLLMSFVRNMGEIYGRKSLVYKVYSLIHLANDVRIHGALDKFSCYVFESYLGHIKRMLRTQSRHLSQLSKRLSEQLPMETEAMKKFELTDYLGVWVKPPLCGGQLFGGMRVVFFSITTSKEKDSCIMLRNKKIVLVKHVVRAHDDSVTLYCHEVSVVKPLFKTPCRSNLVSIAFVKNDLIVERIDNFLTKCLINWEHKVAIPMIPCPK